MKNPIGRKNREELELIKLEASEINEKLNKVIPFIEDFEEIKKQVNVLFDFFTADDSPEDLAKAESEAMQQVEMFENVVQSAFMKMMNKPENNEAIATWLGNIMIQASGRGGAPGGMDISQMFGEDGELNTGQALQMALEKFGGGNKESGRAMEKTRSSGSSTGY